MCDVFQQRSLGGRFLFCDIQAGVDNLENVVEVVRDPSSERANIFKLVAFGQFVLEL